MKRIVAVSAFLCLVMLCACSPRDFLTRRLARDLVASSQTFNAPQQFWLRTGTLSNKDFTSPEYLVLQQHGWLSGNSVACPPGTVPPPCWDVSLTPAGVEAFRDLVPAGSAASNYFSVPTARRELIAITGISRNGNLADVDFTWKWKAMNAVGAALYTGDAHYSSTVGFKRYDDGWRIMEGDPAKPDQTLDEALKNAHPAN